MPANAAAATDALAEAVVVEAALAEAVLVEAALAGVAAGGLALPADEELLQPAARPARAASIAVRAATAPIADSILRMFSPLSA